MNTDTERMLDEIERPPAAGWRPEPGDVVVGKVIDVDTTDGGFGPYPVVTVRAEHGDIAIHGFHTVLKGELAKQRPEVGDEIGVKYFGILAGRKYEMYRVRVKKAQPTGPSAPDWDAIGASAEAEAASEPASEPDDDDAF